MIEELRQLEKEIQEDTSWSISISEDLYNLLVSEVDRIEKLFRLVNSKRYQGDLKVAGSKEIISEQTWEINIPEIGLDQDTINKYRTHIRCVRHINDDDEQDPLDEKEVKRIENQILFFFSDRHSYSNDRNKISYDFFLKKPKWSIITHNISRTASIYELFTEMGCLWDDDVEEIFEPMTMNLLQIKWLYRRKLLDLKASYIFFLKRKDGKVAPYRAHYKNIFGPFPKFEGNETLLLFWPEDMLQEEKGMKKRDKKEIAAKLKKERD